MSKVIYEVEEIERLSYLPEHSFSKKLVYMDKSFYCAAVRAALLYSDHPDRCYVLKAVSSDNFDEFEIPFVLGSL
jgi:hypothetical protein